MRKVPPEDFANYMHIYNGQKEADRSNRQRGMRNVSGYLNDLVPNSLKNSLAQEGRSTQNFNLLQYIIRGHVGNALMNWFDPKWSPGEDDPIDAVTALATMYTKQKELHNYKAATRSVLTDGYNYCGVEELVVVRPSSNPRSWGVGFKHRRKELVIFDQNVYSDRISRDSQQCHIISYISPDMMLRIYPHAEREILMACLDMEKRAPMFDAPSQDLFANADRHKLGSNLQVVEWLHIKHNKVQRRFLKNGIQMPETGYHFGSVEDIALTQSWGTRNGIDITDDMVVTITDWMPVLWTTSFCPSLGIMLENRKDFRQLIDAEGKGHIPLYGWAFEQKNGLFIGLTDYLWDTCQDFNNREMAKTKTITKSMISDKMWIRADTYEGDEEKLNETASNMTDGSIPIILPENAPPAERCFGTIKASQVAPSILQDENFKMAFAEKIGMLPPALQGRSERQADSGVAIGRKVMEANVMMKPESESIIQHENDKHEDWTVIAIKLFGHPVQMNRKISSADGKDITIINELVGFDAAGNEIIRNNIGSLKRTSVVISQAKENDYIAQLRRETTVAGLQAMPPSDTNTLFRAGMEYGVATNMEFTSDEERDRIKRLADKQLAIVEAMADQQLAQLQAPPPGPGGPGGAGGAGGAGGEMASPEGAPQGPPPPQGPQGAPQQPGRAGMTSARRAMAPPPPKPGARQ